MRPRSEMSSIDVEIALLRSDLARERARVNGLLDALQWVADRRWSEDADLDEICTYAERAMKAVE
jgi:inorganic triphosphatase YgiF